MQSVKVRIPCFGKEWSKWKIASQKEFVKWWEKVNPLTYWPILGYQRFENYRPIPLIEMSCQVSHRWRTLSCQAKFEMSPKLRLAFKEGDIKKILQIPLSMSLREDKWSWVVESTWNFFVKSAYMLDQCEHLKVVQGLWYTSFKIDNWFKDFGIN